MTIDAETPRAIHGNTHCCNLTATFGYQTQPAWHGRVWLVFHPAEQGVKSQPRKPHNTLLSLNTCVIYIRIHHWNPTLSHQYTSTTCDIDCVISQHEHHLLIHGESRSTFPRRHAQHAALRLKDNMSKFNQMLYMNLSSALVCTPLVRFSWILLGRDTREYP